MTRRIWPWAQGLVNCENNPLAAGKCWNQFRKSLAKWAQ